ncbi:MAG: 4-hydroxy-tetrahydrodipicolinate reductase [Muribaculaceae bacterium]|nr:4-hydroxy-tetrahydrodipicolinate reductase [Muribaculaceae bacterium]
MKIAIIGYGKMGRIIENIALQRGHDIVSIIDVDNHADINSDAFRSADVAIEFTTPSTAETNCREAMAQGVPVVSGSTGWSDGIERLKPECDATGATLMWSSNYSLGVNLFFAINRYVTAVMSRFSQYTPSLNEIHHIHKLDHPSGTAITLAQQIIEGDQALSSWTEEIQDKTDDTLLITHQRQGEVPGTHAITWDSPVDTVTIEHRAKSREGFALGAVMAAEWIQGRRGFFTMDDMMHSILPAKLFDIASEK